MSASSMPETGHSQPVLWDNPEGWGGRETGGGSGWGVEKEMATHSSVLAWTIPGMVEPGGLPSVGSHRVGHN